MTPRWLIGCPGGSPIPRGAVTGSEDDGHHVGAHRRSGLAHLIVEAERAAARAGLVRVRTVVRSRDLHGASVGVDVGSCGTGPGQVHDVSALAPATDGAKRDAPR